VTGHWVTSCPLHDTFSFIIFNVDNYCHKLICIMYTSVHLPYYVFTLILLFIQVSALFSVNKVTPPMPPPKRPKSGMRVLSLFDGISTGKNSSPQHQIICYSLDTHKHKSLQEQNFFFLYLFQEYKGIPVKWIIMEYKAGHTISSNRWLLSIMFCAVRWLKETLAVLCLMWWCEASDCISYLSAGNKSHLHILSNTYLFSMRVFSDLIDTKLRFKFPRGKLHNFSFNKVFTYLHFCLCKDKYLNYYFTGLDRPWRL
jgi:hypothetical protein